MNEFVVTYAKVWMASMVFLFVVGRTGGLK